MKTFEDYGIQVNGGSGNVRMTCPRCSSDRKNSREKCLSVDTDRGVWYCHHCDWAGGLPKEDYQKVDIIGQPVYREPDCNVDFEAVAEYPMSDKGVVFFNKRRISKPVLIRNKVTATNAAIQFPFLKNGKPVNIKTRKVSKLPDGTVEKKFYLEKDCEKVPFGWDDINLEQTIIVEGEMDKLAVEEAGFVNCISVPNGAKSLGFLQEYGTMFAKIKQFIIAVDSDTDGKKLEAELSTRLGKDKCLKVTWPDGCKDANDVLMNRGAEALELLIKNAKSYPIDGVYRFDDFRAELKELYANDLKRGLNQGVGYDFYSVALGELTAITGIPNHGKSSVLNQMLINLIKNYNAVNGKLDKSVDFRVGVFSPEMMPAQNYIGRTCAQFKNKPFEKKYTNRISEEELDLSTAFLNEHIFILNPDIGDAAPMKLLSLARSLVLTQSVKGIVIDPFNKLEHCRKAMDLTEGEYVAWFLNSWQSFARQYNVHVWIVVHPRKMQRDPKNPGEYEIPSIYDIIGSSNFAGICDNILCCHRSIMKNDPYVYLYTIKIRNFWVGTPGGCSKLLMDTESKSFINAPEDSDEELDNYFNTSGD